MVEFTFLEVHLDGAEFTANAPGSDALPRDDADDSAESGLGSGSGSEGGSSPIPALLAVVGLVIAVVVVRRVIGGSGEPVLEE